MSNLLEQASLVMIPSGYKEDVVYSQIPLDGSGDLQLTRASNGTRINSAGLVEDMPWNLCTYSNDFSSNWPFVGSSKSTGVTDPIGNSNAIKLKYTTATSGHYITQSIILTGSNAHSVYAKAGELQFLQIASAQSIDEYVNFNLSTGAIGTYGSLASNVQIESVGNGWYRCSVVFTNGSNGICLAIVQSASSGWFGVSTYAGANSTDGLYLYGGQLNTGALKPYFPTTDRLNVPRLTYQNGGGGCPSLLLEKQSTNLFAQSNNFTSVGDWYIYKDSGSTFTETSNYGVSPDGTQNATRLQANITAGVYANYARYFAVSIGTTYTYSIYIKSLSGTPTIRFTTPNGSAQNITLTTNWERYTYTFTATSADFYGNFYIQSPTSLSYDLLAYGAQLEASSYPTSYIPTTSSSATRVADACSKTGISSLIGQTSGTIFLDGYFQPNDTGWGEVIRLQGASSGDSIVIYFNPSGQFYFEMAVGGVSQASGYLSYAGGRLKIAIAYANNDVKIYINGTEDFADTSASIPTCSSLYLLYGPSAQNKQGQVNETALFKTRLTNAELASLTTI